MTRTVVEIETALSELEERRNAILVELGEARHRESGVWLARRPACRGFDVTVKPFMGEIVDRGSVRVGRDFFHDFGGDEQVLVSLVVDGTIPELAPLSPHDYGVARCGDWEEALFSVRQLAENWVFRR